MGRIIRRQPFRRVRRVRPLISAVMTVLPILRRKVDGRWKDAGGVPYPTDEDAHTHGKIGSLRIRGTASTT